MNSISINKILTLIPHRYPFLLIDKVLSVSHGEEITAIKNVTYNEPFFNGHFPEHPIMPGVLIIESMAQTGALMVTSDPEFNPSEKLVYFMSIDNAKFRKPVTPGDTLKIYVKKIHARKNVWKLDCAAFVDQIKVSEALISAMIIDR